MKGKEQFIGVDICQTPVPLVGPITSSLFSISAAEISPETVHYKQYPQVNMLHYTASTPNIFLMHFYN